MKLLKYIILLSIIVGCETTSIDDFESSQRAMESNIDKTIKDAYLNAKTIIEASPNPSLWGKLYLMEYQSDYRVSGLQWFQFVDINSVKFKENGHNCLYRLKIYTASK